MEAPVELTPYNPKWPAAFESERALLVGILGPWLTGPIEHVGSTAVKGNELRRFKGDHAECFLTFECPNEAKS